ncbi:MAG: Flp pilus assembly complex ATPase component TadA [Desulfovibrionaceae bacterium]|nr:Flp pilus assembly complex ATPase component TadA [Desulfovibrionaceae bacterium]
MSEALSCPDVLYPGVLRHTVTREMVNDFLLWAVSVRASDIVFRADDPPWIQVDGRWFAVSDHFTLSFGETQLLTNLFSGQEHKAGNVQRGMSADFAYSVRVSECRGLMQRFRVNVTASNAGHYIVLRALPTALPSLSDCGLPDDLVRHCYPHNGLVLISGVMGSGKSTLLAALLHAAIVKRSCGGLGIGRHILTLEHPIEFDLTRIPHASRSAPITQSEVEAHVSSWPLGVRSMTRRKGEIVMVGEARDQETLRAMLTIAEQGVTCYATVHAQDVPQTITRIVNTFPLEERAPIAAALKANLRLILHQRLVPGKSTGRVALREYLVFDEALRMQLYATPYEALIPTVRAKVEERGRTLIADCTEKYAAGLLRDETYASLVQEQRACAGLDCVSNKHDM